jgi:sulfur-carrier protein adenylyltransferase/sulfurtransferase
MNRFERQHILSGFGVKGQDQLRNARVLVVGAGGLGCPALLYLAAAGIGTLGIIDGDKVSLSNLNRQVLFGIGDVDKPKAETAGHFLKNQYPDITIDIYGTFLTVENCLEILGKYDLIVDGSDNFPTRYLVSDACALLQKPVVMGAIYKNEGQVAVFDPRVVPGISYRDIYPDPPQINEIPNCNETGVLGVLPGIIGTLQAAEAIKYLTGFGTSLVNKMLFYNLINHQVFEMEITPNPHKKGPKNIQELMQTAYTWICGTIESLDWKAALPKINSAAATLLDVREEHELPKLDSIPYTSLPYSKLKESWKGLLAHEEILVFCQSGIRSIKAANELQQLLPGKRIYSITGGILDSDSPINKN